MDMDLLNLYRQASEWTVGKVAVATDKLESATPCDEWNVRTLMNHMLDTQRYFVGTARGEDVSPPSPNPPALLDDDPVADFERARDDTLRTFGEDGVIEQDRSVPRHRLRRFPGARLGPRQGDRPGRHHAGRAAGCGLHDAPRPAPR